jgi:mono/diheme cytochrome c family protein
MWSPIQELPVYLQSEASLEDALVMLGADKAPHIPDSSLKNVSAQNGKSIVMDGYAIRKGGTKTKKQSAHFTCISCHNIKKEDPDLANPNPEDRLKYVKENNLPFLQGSPLYGVVNRRSFYNGAYKMKYGELVEPAKNNLREAIHLCAVECSQGRPLKDWEMESVLAYLWEIDLKIGDLDLTNEEVDQINVAIDQDTNKEEFLELLQSKYLQASEATFMYPPEERKKGYELVGNPDNGQLIYELSCLHCHENKKYSFFNLDNATSTFRYLTKHMSKYTRYSLYQVARWGTEPIPGKKAYMPWYTEEKMNNQQIEDLRSYIEKRAYGNTKKPEDNVDETSMQE